MMSTKPNLRSKRTTGKSTDNLSVPTEGPINDGEQPATQPADSPNIPETEALPVQQQSPLLSKDSSTLQDVKLLLSDDKELVSIVAATISKHILSSPDLMDKIISSICGNETVIRSISDAIIDQVSQNIYSSISMDNETIAGDIITLQEQNDRLRKEHRGMVDKIDDLEQYSRRNCLLIHGVPETANENTDTLTLDIITSRICEDMELIEIDRTHRLGRKRVLHNNKTRSSSKPRPRPIIVKFSTYRARAEVFRNKKLLKNSSYSITENLTPSRMTLLREAGAHAAVEAAWSLDGRINCLLHNKKKIVIRSTSDLRNL
ncbi:uncharacterized protein [Antedon mediterranea]|uniref:uncharacterized protein n=1 Tax=Antedon mediterranea TaxID=105859 RepID=UPI003AF5020E